MSIRCWFCDEAIDPESVEAEGFLIPRKTSEGGPIWRLDCPHCGTENGAERNRAGAFLLVPRVPTGVRGWVVALFSPGRWALRGHARAWHRTHAEQRTAFHAVPPRPRPRPEPDDAEPEPHETVPPEEPDDSERRLTDEADRAAALIEHYRTLEVALSASREEITAAYRRLSQRCHPDKVAHLDEEFQELASRKFREIRVAYEAILASL